MAKNKNEVSAMDVTTAGCLAGGFFTLAKETHSHIHHAINNTSHPQEIPKVIANIFSTLMTFETGEKLMYGGAIGAAAALVAYAFVTGKVENAEPTQPLTSSVFSNYSN